MLPDVTSLVLCNVTADDGRTLVDLSENGWHALLETQSSKEFGEEEHAAAVNRPAVQNGLSWAKKFTHE